MANKKGNPSPGVRGFIMRAIHPEPYVKGRMYEIAMGLSQAGGMAGRVELANEALAALFHLLYTRDDDTAHPHLDPVTMRIKMPLPWGSRGWKHWKAIRRWESDVLRRILLERQRARAPGRRPAPLVWDEDERHWWLNVPDYPTVESALTWLQRSEFSLAEWRLAVQYLRRHGADSARKRRR